MKDNQDPNSFTDEELQDLCWVWCNRGCQRDECKRTLIPSIKQWLKTSPSALPISQESLQYAKALKEFLDNPKPNSQK